MTRDFAREWHAFTVIAAKELIEACRNRWLASGAFLFAALALAVIFGTAAVGGTLVFRDLATVMNSFVSLTVYVLPLLAVLTVSEAFAAESEHGTLVLMLTYPLSRTTWVLGKIAGFAVALFGVFAFAIAVVLLARAVLPIEWPWIETIKACVKLLLTGWLYGLAYISLGCWVSLLVRTKAQALSILVLLWFFLVFLYDLVLLTLAVASDGAVSRDVLSWLMTINCADAFRMINTVAVNGDWTANAWAIMAVLVLWVLFGTGLSLTAVKRCRL